MRVLLDTHAFLWWTTRNGALLSDRARDLLADGETQVAFSIVSAWEIAIKAGAGRLELPLPADQYVPDRLRKHGFELLAIDLAHALHAGSLPRIHADPFDRMLVAQAQVEGIPLITADPAIGRYDVEVIW